MDRLESLDSTAPRKSPISRTTFIASVGLASSIAGLLSIPALIASNLTAPAWAQVLTITLALGLLFGTLAWYRRESQRKAKQARLALKAANTEILAWTKSLEDLLTKNRILRLNTVSGELEKLLLGGSPDRIEHYLEHAIIDLLQYLNRGLEQLMPGRKIMCQLVWSKDPARYVKNAASPLQALIGFKERYEKRIRKESAFLTTSSRSIYHHVMSAKGQGLAFQTFEELTRKNNFDRWSGMELHVQSGVIALVEVNGHVIGCLSADCPDQQAFVRGAYLIVRCAADAIAVLLQVGEFAANAAAKLASIQGEARKKVQAAEAQLKIMQEAITLVVFAAFSA